jgi:hypothetical protein
MAFFNAPDTLFSDLTRCFVCLRQACKSPISGRAGCGGRFPAAQKPLKLRGAEVSAERGTISGQPGLETAYSGPTTPARARNCYRTRQLRRKQSCYLRFGNGAKGAQEEVAVIPRERASVERSVPVIA